MKFDIEFVSVFAAFQAKRRESLRFKLECIEEKGFSAGGVKFDIPLADKLLHRVTFHTECLELFMVQLSPTHAIPVDAPELLS